MVKWVFTHSDGDGVCSGALALAANPDARVFFTHPSGLLEDLENVRVGDSIVICDIALPEDKLTDVLTRFSEIAKYGELIYIDHHPLPETITPKDIPGKVLHAIGSSASELAYVFFQERLAHTISRVAIYGAISDYMDRTPTISMLLQSWDKRTIYFETGVLVQGLESFKRDHDFKRKIVSHLAANNPPSLCVELLEAAIENTKRENEIIRSLGNYIKVYGNIAYAINVPFSLGKTAIYVRALANTPVGLAGEERRGFIDMSLRTCEESIDLNSILRRISPKLGGSGGGHREAAGARVPKENFQKFIEELDKALKGTYER
ncbi:MAG: DHHA1 domain-containing protein [Candidatus Bathyarchaeia archaeon]|nr:DHH family phosphoesterase [Candidatus Bathyarchaeota archaeon]